MLLVVADGNGVLQNVITNGQEAVTDGSGVIQNNNQATVFAANLNRSGWVFQNNGENPMQINILGAGGSFIVMPGAMISTKMQMPVTTGAITVTGTPNDPFTAHQW